MAASLGSLVVSLEANTAQFTAAMDKSAYQTEKAMQKMVRDAEMVGRAMGAMAVVGAGALAVMVKSSLDAMDKMSKMAQQAGTTVEGLSSLGYAAQLAGVGNNELGAALVKLSKNMSDAAMGTGEAGKGFDALGISVKNADGSLKSNDAVLKEIADQFSRFKDGAEKTAIAVNIFGRSGAQLIPLLNSGADGLREMHDEADRFGLVLDTGTSVAAEKFNDTMTKIALQQTGFANALTTAVLPLLQVLADEMLSASEQSNKFALATAAVRTVLETIVVIGSEVAFVFKAVGTEIGGITAQFVALSKFDMQGFNAISEAMKADAELARKEHDKFIADILNRTANVGSVAGGVTAPSKTGAPRMRSGSSNSSQISEGQRLIQQLSDRLMAEEKLTEVEKLAAQFASDRYGKATAGEREIAIGIAAQIDARKAMQTELDAEIDRIKQLISGYSAADARLQSLVAGTDRGKNTQNMLDEALAESALRDGKIDLSTYDQIIAKMREVKDEGKDTFKDLQNAIDGWGKQSAAAIVDFAMTGKASFGDMANSIISDMLRMIVQQNITAPLAKMVGGFNWGGLFANADGGVYSSPSLSAYSGQVVSSPTMFAFAKGAGVMGEAGPEAIMPLKRGSDGKLGISGGGGSNVQVNVIESPGSGKGGTTQTRDDGGKTIIDVFVEQVKGAIAKDIGSGGMVAGAMESQYGLNRAAGAWR